MDGGYQDLNFSSVFLSDDLIISITTDSGVFVISFWYSLEVSFGTLCPAF